MIRVVSVNEGLVKGDVEFDRFDNHLSHAAPNYYVVGAGGGAITESCPCTQSIIGKYFPGTHALIPKTPTR